MQGAGQEKCSCLHTSFIVQEAVAHNVNKGGTVYVAFLDTRKAFDTVWIDGMLYRLYQEGMNTKTWRLIKDAYTDFKCAIYLDGKTGEWFGPERGVHQGAPFSMRLYKVFLNDLLKQLRSNNHGVTIGNIDVTCPTSADDIAIMALYKVSLNALLNVAYQYSCKWRFSYNLTKCVAMVHGKEQQTNVPISMGDTQLEIVNVTKHMGVSLTNDTVTQKNIVSQRIGAGRKVLYAAKGLGSAMAPVTPAVLSKIYWSVAVPKMVYGLDVTPVNDACMAELESAHRQHAKVAQGIPDNIPRPAPLAILGWLTMQAYIAMIN